MKTDEFFLSSSSRKTLLSLCQNTVTLSQGWGMQTDENNVVWSEEIDTENFSLTYFFTYIVV